MIRLFIVVEGKTEERFVKRVLGPHLDALGVYTTCYTVTTRRDPHTGAKVGRGGGHWKHWLHDVKRVTTAQRGDDVRVTTLFDLYGLPEDFPELDQHARLPDTATRVARLEQAMATAVGDPRFIPYLQRHEMETLVLAVLDVLGTLLDTRKDIEGCARLAAEVGHLCPEDVNDGQHTAPSKRLAARIPAYDKAQHGPEALALAGLDEIRAACPRFHAWLTRLEQLASGAAS